MDRVLTCRVCRIRQRVPASRTGRHVRCEVCAFGTRLRADAPLVDASPRRFDAPMQVAAGAVGAGVVLLLVAGAGILF